MNPRTMSGRTMSPPQPQDVKLFVNCTFLTEAQGVSEKKKKKLSHANQNNFKPSHPPCWPVYGDNGVDGVPLISCAIWVILAGIRIGGGREATVSPEGWETAGWETAGWEVCRDGDSLDETACKEGLRRWCRGEWAGEGEVEWFPGMVKECPLLAATKLGISIALVTVGCPIWNGDWSCESWLWCTEVVTPCARLLSWSRLLRLGRAIMSRAEVEGEEVCGGRLLARSCCIAAYVPQSVLCPNCSPPSVRNKTTTKQETIKPEIQFVFLIIPHC